MTIFRSPIIEHKRKLREMNNKDLLPCPFKRGQVWENPNGSLMMVLDVEEYKNRGHQISYVTDECDIGIFFTDDTEIINNCNLYRADLAPAPKVDTPTPPNAALDEGYDDGYRDGFADGKKEAQAFDLELRRAVFKFLEDRQMLEKGEEYTAQDIYDALHEHERQVKAALRNTETKG